MGYYNKFFRPCLCPYCKQVNGFPVLWKIPEDRYWYEVPKNASMSIKKLGGHVIECKERFELDKSIKPIVVYRDPIERFLSLFKHYFTKHGTRYSTKGEPWLKQYGFDIENYDTDEDSTKLLEFVVQNLYKIGTEEEVHHFYPQTSFIEPEIFDEFEIVSIERVSEKLNAAHLHKTEFNGKFRLTKTNKDAIRDIYKSDYDYFVGKVNK